MRKKIAACLGLLLLVLATTLLAAWFLPPAEPQMRVGMTVDEVHEVLGEPCGWDGASTYGYDIYSGPLGSHCFIAVNFGSGGRVDKWRVDPQPDTRPPWLDSVMKWAGW